MDLKDYKRVSSGSEFRDVVQTSDTEPRFRSNGHQLELKASNQDDINIDDGFNNFFLSEIDFRVKFKTDGVGRVYNRGVNGSMLSVRIFSTGSISIKDGTTTLLNLLNLFTVGEIVDFQVKNLEVIVNGVVVGTMTDQAVSGYAQGQVADRAVVLNRDASAAAWGNNTYYEVESMGESYDPTNINANAQIEGSNGTIAQVNSSAADPINYILGTVFQKSGFALVGNGSTQKIVSPLGGEIVLTSTPLDGGFDLDNKTYKLTEGLGNVIKSTEGTTECDIVGFSGTSLNFGGWLKGDNLNGWNPYTV